MIGVIRMTYRISTFVAVSGQGCKEGSSTVGTEFSENDFYGRNGHDATDDEPTSGG